MPSTKCQPGCSCKRHQGPWAGKKRPGMHGHNGTHGQSRIAGTNSATPTYRSWSGMKFRCAHHARYAGRIKVCERWMTFENFLADMGERPEGMSLDRINNYGDYEPGNCRWATALEQQNNRRPSSEWSFARG